MSVNVTATVSNSINFVAASVGRCPILENVKITNCEGLEKVILKIKAEPEIVYDYEEVILVEGREELTPEIRFTMKDEVYRENVREAKDGNLKIQVFHGEKQEMLLATLNIPVHLEPYLHYNIAEHEETLPCWSTPNQVEELTTLAAKLAAAENVAMVGYQWDDPALVEKQVRFACEAFGKMGIPYTMPPASYEMTGQIVRPAKWVLSEKREKATCIDSTVTLGAELESLGFHVFFILTRNHAFLAVSKNEKFMLPKVLVRKTEMGDTLWSQIEEQLIPIESTTFTANNKNASFESSVSSAKASMSKLESIIDVRLARMYRLLPVFSAYEANPICQNVEINKVDVQRATVPASKLDILKKQAINTSYHNKLLNGKASGNELQFSFPLEEFLTKEFTEEQFQSLILKELLNAGLDKDEIHRKMGALLVENRKLTKASGYSKLNLALGQLSFTDTEGKRYQAPLYICPAELYPNKRNDFILKVADKSYMKFNPVLKELLYQKYGIDITELSDNPKENLEKELDTLHYRTEKCEDLSLVRNVAHLGIFHTPNEAICEGLNHENVLTHVVNQGILTENIKAAECDRSHLKKECVYPFKADCSQRKIIEHAFDNGVQAVVGPAGNGKTTTIANVHAKAYVEGKSVLTIAQQDAAHEVLKDKMHEIGLEQAFLQIIRSTSNYQNVANKVEKAITAWEEHEQEHLDAAGSEKKFRRAEEELKEYYHLMKDRLCCGKTPEQLLEMAETYRECDVKLDWTVDERTSYDEMERIFEEFAEVLCANKFAGQKYVEFLRYKEMTQEDRDHLRPRVKHALKKGEELIDCVNLFRVACHLPQKEAEGARPYMERVLKHAKQVKESPDSAPDEECRKLAEAVMKAYHEYGILQRKMENSVIKNESKFREKHGDKLKMMLFKAWLAMDEAELNLEEYSYLKAEAKEAGMESLLAQLEAVNHNLGKDDMMNAFKKSWCMHQLALMEEERPELKKYSQIRLHNQISRYAEEDYKLRKDIRSQLMNAYVDNLEKVKDSELYRKELANLKKLVRQRKKGSVRSFFEQAPHMMQKLFPVISMTPEAAAEYLPMDYPTFDLVIIDEASQLPTYKALIPISKSKGNCLFFGDERQLAVSKSFVKLLEDEDGDRIPLESLLEAVVISNAPTKTLKTHYRSESEALFAFPLAKYYDNVVTIPDCKIDTQALSYEYVDCKTYDRSKTRTNVTEAKCVMNKILEHMENGINESGETLGVLTMNINQRNLIQSLLLNESAANEEIRDMLLSGRLNVLSLEEAQGKEADHVIISFGNGYDNNGKFSCNFGGFVQEGGKNRLNTLITRQRKSLHVITSMTPEMLEESTSEGIRDLREFLLFARGDLKFDNRRTEKTANNDKFMLSEKIAESLRKMGYQVHTNIGNSKFKVDIAIVSPLDSNTYSLGILLDHFEESSDKIYDREIIYPELLRKKGWNIYRVHNWNYLKNPEKELERILLRAEGIIG